jgi:hypothetical protein
MEEARTSETSVDNYFTRQYIPEDNSEPLRYVQFPLVTTADVNQYCDVASLPPQSFLSASHSCTLRSATSVSLHGIRCAANFYYKLYLNNSTFTALNLLHVILNY